MFSLLNHLSLKRVYPCKHLALLFLYASSSDFNRASANASNKLINLPIGTILTTQTLDRCREKTV